MRYSNQEGWARITLKRKERVCGGFVEGERQGLPRQQSR
jgi:hypothetical protein